MSYDPFAVPVEPVPPAKPASHPETADLVSEPSFVPAGSRVAVFQNGRHVATIPGGAEWYEADPWTGKIVRRVQPGEDLAAILDIK